MRARWLCFLVAVVCLAMTNCSEGPAAPAGEEHFKNVKTNLNNMEFENALKNMDQAIKASGTGPIAQQANLLQVALMTASADSSKSLAEAYGLGGKSPNGRPKQAQFVKMRSDYYGIARVRLLSAMQTVMGQRNKLPEKPMPLNVEFPAFSGQDPATVNAVRDGTYAADADRFRAEQEMIRNAFARVLAALAGAGDNLPKGQEIFKKGSVEVDPRTYLVELTATFYRLSDIFDRRGLDDSRTLRVALEAVRDNMDAALKLLSNKPDKDLEEKAKKVKDDCEKKLKAMK